jgi:hypothetical protein
MKDVQRAVAMVLVACLGAAAILAYTKAEAAVSLKKEGVEIVLRDQQEDCPKGAKRAMWIQKDGEIKGCWMAYDGEYLILFEDGDKFRLPMSQFNEASV